MVIGKHFSKYYLKYAFTFIIGILALVFVDYAQLKIPEIVGQLVDGIKAANIEKETLIGFIKTLLIVALCVFVGRFLWRICIFGNAVKIEADIRNEMFRHMEKLSADYFQENKTGALMALYTNDLNTIRQSFGSGTLMLIDALALGILAFYKMIKLNYKLAIVCLIPLLIVSVFAASMRKRISRKVKKNLEAFSDLSDYVQEDFSGINVIKAYVKEKRKEFLFCDYNQKNMDTCIDFVKDQVLVQIVINIILTTISLTIIFIGGIIIYQFSTGASTLEFSVGQLTEFNAYFGSIIWPVMAVGELINLRGQSRASEKRVSELLDQKVEINDNLVTKENEEFAKEPLKGDIVFDHLNFAYKGADKNTLTDVSFHINQGEIVGIMGNTGSGKTTIVELLLRIYNIENNYIYLDGKDIMELPLKYVRDNIAYVPQETFLFKQTIDENISFSLDEVNKDLSHEAARYASIEKDIKEFADGFDTVLGERGVTVSGGQKQRISIARALIKDAPILIMDDSLSAVDTITEREILSYLRNVRKGKTTIIIAHRITTLESLDKIIVINDGTVDSIGNHDELIKSCKIYQKEVELQALEKAVEGN